MSGILEAFNCLLGFLLRLVGNWWNVFFDGRRDERDDFFAEIDGRFNCLKRYFGLCQFSFLTNRVLMQIYFCWQYAFHVITWCLSSAALGCEGAASCPLWFSVSGTLFRVLSLRMQ